MTDRGVATVAMAMQAVAASKATGATFAEQLQEKLDAAGERADVDAEGALTVYKDILALGMV